MDTITTMQIAFSDAPRVSADGFRLLAPVGVEVQGTTLSAIVACVPVAKPESAYPTKGAGVARLSGVAPFAGAARTATQIITHNSMDDSVIRTGRPPV